MPFSIPPREPRSATGPSHGVYGIGLDGATLARALLNETDGRWSEVYLEQRIGVVDGLATHFEQDYAQFSLMGSGSLCLDRRQRLAVFTLPERLPDAALAHPYLGPVGAVFGLWAGREAIHAGAFVGQNGIWSLLGDRESGKSSTLASLLAAGLDVVCDDVLVADGSTAFAGPRCIDLRGPAAARLRMGELVPLPGDRERWRVPLRAVEPELPLRGWIYLEWGSSVALSRVPVMERLSRLAAHRSMTVVPPRLTTLLELAALPAWTLTRPKDWAVMPAVLDAVLKLSSS